MVRQSEETQAITGERSIFEGRASHIEQARESIKTIPIEAWHFVENGILLESASYSWEDARRSNNGLSPSFLVEIDLLKRQVSEVLLEFHTMEGSKAETHQYHGEEVDVIFNELESAIREHRTKQSASAVLSLDNLAKPLQATAE